MKGQESKHRFVPSKQDPVSTSTVSVTPETIVVSTLPPIPLSGIQTTVSSLPLPGVSAIPPPLTDPQNLLSGVALPEDEYLTYLYLTPPSQELDAQDHQSVSEATSIIASSAHQPPPTAAPSTDEVRNHYEDQEPRNQLPHPTMGVPPPMGTRDLGPGLMGYDPYQFRSVHSSQKKWDHEKSDKTTTVSSMEEDWIPIASPWGKTRPFEVTNEHH